MQLYVASEHGETPEFLIDDDWQVFSERLLAQSGFPTRDLLLAILEFGLDPRDYVDERDYRCLFGPLDSTPLDLHGDWDARVERLLMGTASAAEPSDENGDEGGNGPRYDAVVDAVDSVGLSYVTSHAHFRARIHKDRARRTRFAPEEMGAPTPDVATAGRANREHEPVLYLASDDRTAIAEVRAWRGAIVGVAPMTLSGPLRILNLVKVPRLRSPFEAGEELLWLLEARSLLQRFGAELSRPVIPGEESRHYLPSQKICDVAREAGFDGVAYPSAMGRGHNVVLFDVASARADSVAYYRVGQPSFGIVPYAEPEVVVDDWPYE